MVVSLFKHRTALSGVLVLCTLSVAVAGPPPGDGMDGGPPGGGGEQQTSETCSGTCGLNLPGKYLEETSGSNRVIWTNGVPNHSYYTNFSEGNRRNPNGVCEHNRKMTLPLQPSLGAGHTSTSLGPVGILITGGFIYNHLDGPEANDNDLAIPNREESMDTCNGHPDPSCRYHYHKNPEGCISGYSDCKLVGHLGDGFPIYSFCTVGGVQLKSCWKLSSGAAGTDSSHFTFDSAAKAAGTCHLDESNGYCFTDDSRGIAATENGGSCRYGYVLTPNYPFVVPSYRGATWYGLETVDSLPSGASGATAPVAGTTAPSTGQEEQPTQSLSPPAVARARIRSTVGLAGVTVGTFDEAKFKAGVAAHLGVSASDVSVDSIESTTLRGEGLRLSLRAAGVRVSFTVEVPEEAATASAATLSDGIASGALATKLQAAGLAASSTTMIETPQALSAEAADTSSLISASSSLHASTMAAAVAAALVASFL